MSSGKENETISCRGEYLEKVKQEIVKTSEDNKGCGYPVV